MASNWPKRLGSPKAKHPPLEPSSASSPKWINRPWKQALEAVLSAWNEQVLVALGQKAPHPIAALSVHGKTLRGTRKQQALDAHLLSAVSHGLGLCLHQEAVTDKENEIVALNRLLGDLLLKGRVLTMDALLTQKQIARQIVLKGGTL